MMIVQQLNKVEIGFNTVYIYVCLWENRGTKHVSQAEALSHPYDFPPEVALFKRPLADTEFDMPSVDCT
jgi:hypothetical protein